MRLIVVLVLSLAACSSTTPPPNPITAVPVTDTVSASGGALVSAVDVVRDQWGIPHIYGQSIPDVAYAQGYFMAQDRWVELDLLRRAADGSLAAILGSLEVPADIGMRMHHLRATAETGLANFQASSDATDQLLVKTLDAFAAGVNQWQADLSAGKFQLPAQLAPVYNVASITPWKAEDSLLLGEFLAWRLAFDDYEDGLRPAIDAAVAQKFPAGDPRANLAQDLEDVQPADPTFTVPGMWGFDVDNSLARAEPRQLKGRARAKALGKLRGLLDGDLRSLQAMGFTSARQHGYGSNNWIIGPKLSKTGHVLVANDTHLALQNPPIFYMNHLVARPDAGTALNVMGEQFPGVPAVTLGMNQHAAWAATTNYVDVTDLYQIAISQCGTGNFCTTFNGQSVMLKPRVESFDVGTMGQVQTGAVSVTFYDDPNHGPILPRLNADNTLQPLNVGGSEISVRYTGYTSAPLLRAVIGIDLAGSMSEAVAALDPNFRYGGENWVIGDDQGNFGWTQTCEVPLRNVPANQSTVVPYKILPGDGTAEWGADMDAHFIPHAYNPAQGFLATANADPIGTTAANDPFYGQPLADGGTNHLYLGVDYDPGTRVGRITKQITNVANDGGQLSLDDMSTIQADAVSEYGQMLAPTFIDAAGGLAAAVRHAPGDGGPSDVSAYALDAGAALQGLFATAQAAVQAWSFDTPSGIGDPDGGAPTAQQVSDSQAALLMSVFFANYAHQTLDDECAAMGQGISDQMLGQTTLRMTVHPELAYTPLSPVTGDPIEFDDLRTPNLIESKRQIAARAIVATLQYLVTQLGGNEAKWRWGQIHRLTLQFALPLGLDIPPATDPVYPQGFPRHGAVGTVDVGGDSFPLTDFTYNAGPAIRFTCELGVDGGPHGRNVLPGGEVFDPQSPHYRDQMELWRKNQTIDWAYQDSDVAASAQTEYANHGIGRTHFQP